MTNVLIGDPIPLAVQVHDNNAALKILARVFTDDGEFLEQKYLYHIEKGLYLNKDIKMPSKNILAVYAVEDSEEYANEAERFSPLEPEKSPEKYVYGFVTEKMTDTEYTQGVVIEATNY